VAAEHAASFLSDPPKGSRHVDLQGLTNVRRTPGTSKFVFANERHHELQVGNVGELRAIVTRALEDIDRRFWLVDRFELIGYAANRLDANDPEWTAALVERDKWLRLIHKRGDGR
jgi:hypothetical protein